ncbi:unnamed protein product, partial [Arabidopsis halleri]
MKKYDIHGACMIQLTYKFEAVVLQFSKIVTRFSGYSF